MMGQPCGIAGKSLHLRCCHPVLDTASYFQLFHLQSSLPLMSWKKQWKTAPTIPFIHMGDQEPIFDF